MQQVGMLYICIALKHGCNLGVITVNCCNEMMWVKLICSMGAIVLRVIIKLKVTWKRWLLFRVTLGS